MPPAFSHSAVNNWRCKPNLFDCFPSRRWRRYLPKPLCGDRTDRRSPCGMARATRSPRSAGRCCCCWSVFTITLMRPVSHNTPYDSLSSVSLSPLSSEAPPLFRRVLLWCHWFNFCLLSWWNVPAPLHYFGARKNLQLEGDSGGGEAEEKRRGRERQRRGVRLL